MKEIIENILVVGHHNPDMDASASATAYADFLNQIGRYESPAIGAIPGDLTPQARFVFEAAGLDPPLNVDNVAPRVGHIMTKEAKWVTAEDRVGPAVESLVRSDMSMLPVIDQDQKVSGIFSNRSDAARFLLGFDPTPLWGTLLTIQDLAAMPGMDKFGTVTLPETTEGELRVALDGDPSWQQEISNKDVLICGNLAALDDLTPPNLPGCVVVVNNMDLRGSQRLSRLNQHQVCVIQYQQSVAELLRGLTMQIQLGSMSLPIGACVGELDRVEDISPLLVDSAHALPVVDGDDQFVGVVSHGDLSRECRCRVVLVDHFEIPQSVPGVEHAEVLEIVDHHRVGDIQTGNPIRVECRPVGSTCTIIAATYFECGLTPSKSIATLMLGGIMADTLVLNGPTTTDVDRTVAPRLAEIAGVDLQQFGTDVLVAADDLMSADPNLIWNRDQKQFSIRNQNFSVAQLETASLDRITKDKLQEFEKIIHHDRAKHGRLISLLVLTDVIKRDSWIFCSENEEAEGVTRQAFGDDQPFEGWTQATGVVSRKKQIIPKLVQALAS
ncbi:MAG: putative manganese-dependent inorganic diphosphatase [Planctomycetota bacterium]